MNSSGKRKDFEEVSAGEKVQQHVPSRPLLVILPIWLRFCQSGWDFANFLSILPRAISTTSQPLLVILPIWLRFCQSRPICGSDGEEKRPRVLWTALRDEDQNKYGDDDDEYDDDDDGDDDEIDDNEDCGDGDSDRNDKRMQLRLERNGEIF